MKQNSTQSLNEILKVVTEQKTSSNQKACQKATLLFTLQRLDPLVNPQNGQKLIHYLMLKPPIKLMNMAQFVL